MRRVAADPRVEERRGGASLGRREPDRPVAPAMLVVKYCMVGGTYMYYSSTCMYLGMRSVAAEIERWFLNDAR